MDAGHQHVVALVQVIMIDVALAGDNALVVGLAASQVARENRAHVIFWGIVGAVLLRVVFAAVTVDVFAIVGMTLAGGLLLLWVCWKLARELRRSEVSASLATSRPVSPFEPNLVGLAHRQTRWKSSIQAMTSPALPAITRSGRRANS